MTKTEPCFTAEPPTLMGSTVIDPIVLPVASALNSRALTPAEFQGLAEVPLELEWVYQSHQSQNPPDLSAKHQ